MCNLVLAVVCGLFIGLIVFLICITLIEEKAIIVSIIAGIVCAVGFTIGFNNVSRITYYDELKAMNIKLEELEKEKQETTADNKFMITNEIAEMKSAIYLKEKEKTYWWNWHLK